MKSLILLTFFLLLACTSTNICENDEEKCLKEVEAKKEALRIRMSRRFEYAGHR